MTAPLVVLAFSAAALLASWRIFRRVALPRPPLGVLSLGDLAVIMAAVVLVPLLYMVVPLPLVAAVMLLAAASSMHLLFSPLMRSGWLVWPSVVVPLAADCTCAVWLGATHPFFLAINNVVLTALTASVATLWAQSGLRARDAAVLAGAVAVYDLVATGLLPLTDELLERLVTLPLAPMLAWGTGGPEGWLSIGLGDLLLASVAPLVHRKAFGEMAGLTTLATSLGTIGVLVLLAGGGALRGSFPVMVALGPLLILEYLAWRSWLGREQTTWQSLSVPNCGASADDVRGRRARLDHLVGYCEDEI